MNRRVRALTWTIRRKGGFDILLTHAPAAGIHDGDDLPHKGFTAFNQLMDRYSPRYMVHGHVHLNYGMFPRETLYGNTTIVNAYERQMIEF